MTLHFPDTKPVNIGGRWHCRADGIYPSSIAPQYSNGRWQTRTDIANTTEGYEFESLRARAAYSGASSHSIWATRNAVATQRIQSRACFSASQRSSRVCTSRNHTPANGVPNVRRIISKALISTSSSTDQWSKRAQQRHSVIDYSNPTRPADQKVGSSNLFGRALYRGSRWCWSFRDYVELGDAWIMPGRGSWRTSPLLVSQPSARAGSYASRTPCHSAGSSLPEEQC
jgi:hypothetical protein